MQSFFYGKCPDYLTNVMNPVDCGRPRRGLRSSSSSDFSLPQLRTKFEERAFTYASPSAWNSLPKDLRAGIDPGLFRKRLKTHFLVWLSASADITNDCRAHISYNCNKRTINLRNDDDDVG